MLKLALIFLIGIAYAAQTRIKIGSKSWGYQVDLNHGQQIRHEFSNEDGLTSGFYQFKTPNNQTKKLQYTIDPNRMEPDIEFDVVNVPDGAKINENGTECSPAYSNMTFDSIDSNQDFKGHVTLKVGNASYSINFATGDKSNSREEVLTPNGLMYGRYNFMLRNSPYKIVINYKFNSTSPDPTFEVSLFKSSTEIDSISSHRDRDRERESINSIHYNPSASYRAPYQRGGHPHHYNPHHSPYAAAVPSSLSSSSSAGVPSSHSLTRAQYEQSRALSEKYRAQLAAAAAQSSSSSGQSSNHSSVPSWYYNRNKSHEQ